ncbi:glutamate-rich protein 6 [Pitangus sulphuratus]|nr:glutamate-rich protein 6 [Pitangus sulphuratus]
MAGPGTAGPGDGAGDGAGDGPSGFPPPRLPEEDAAAALPPAGLPALLAYRRESSRALAHFEAQDDTEPRCEYCGSLLRPFPLPEDVPFSKDMEYRFCCKSYRDLYEFIMKERKRLRDACSAPRAVSTHEYHGSEAYQLQSKEQENQRYWENWGSGSHQDGSTSPKSRMLMPAGSVAKTEEEPELKPEPEPEHKEEPEEEPQRKPKEESEPKKEPEEEPKPEPKEEPRPGPNLRPESESEKETKPKPKEEPGPELGPKPKKEHKPELEPEKEPKLELEPEKEPKPELEAEKEPKPELEEQPKPELEEQPKPELKEQPKLELGEELKLELREELKLELGEEQPELKEQPVSCRVTRSGFRPLGRKAVQEDEPRTAKIRALFQSDGRSTCYYPNGDEWINMSIQGGQYLDKEGSRVKRWMWPKMSPGPHVPLSPIFISLNRHVGVRILAQDKIIISFLAMGRQAKFNMGTKVQVGAAGRPPAPARLGRDELLLLAFRVRMLQLFDRMRGCISFPSSEQWNKMQPPAYVLTQAAKILELCAAAGISEELRSSIRAIVNAQQL